MGKTNMKLLLVLGITLAMMVTYARVDDIQRRLLRDELARTEQSLSRMTQTLIRAQELSAQCLHDIADIRRELAAVKAKGTGSVDLGGIEVTKEVREKETGPGEAE